VPVLCEGTSRMTRAASDCTGEHGKNYFDSRLMSDKAIFRQLRIPRVGKTVAYSSSGENSKLGYAKDCDLKKNRLETLPFVEEETLQHSRQVNPTKSLALWPPHYRMRGLLQNQEDAAGQEKTVQGTQASNLALTLVVRLPNERLPSVL
jgi:hypothetical protein